MSRFQAAVHNIGHHAVSSLSHLLSVLYAYCSTNEVSVIEIDLNKESLDFEGELRDEIMRLRQKYISILRSTCGVIPDQVKMAYLRIDFLLSDSAYRQHLQHMMAIGVWYGHDPLYEADVIVELKNGAVAKHKFSNRHIHRYA